MKVISGKGTISAKALGWVQVELVSDTECSFVWLECREWSWRIEVKVRKVGKVHSSKAIQAG